MLVFFADPYFPTPLPSRAEMSGDATLQEELCELVLCAGGAFFVAATHHDLEVDVRYPGDEHRTVLVNTQER